MSSNQESAWKSVQNKPRTGRKTQPNNSSTSTTTTTTATATSTHPNTSTNSSTTSNPLPSASSPVIVSASSGGINMNGNVPSSTPPSSSPMENHSLGEAFTFSYFRKEKGVDYEDCMKNVGDFSSVEEFWALYTHMKRPYELKVSMDYHLFKQGIKPMWEDEKNKTGGRLMLRCKSGYSARIWEDLLLSFIGQQFQNNDDINGVVISIRENHDIISIWNKYGDNENVQERLKQDAVNLLNLPSQTKLEYKVHKESIYIHSKMMEMISVNARLDDDADATEVNELEGQLDESSKQR